MVSAICIGTNNLKQSGDFYQAVLATINMVRAVEDELEIGFSCADQPASFWVLKPYDGQPATYGNGTQRIFKAANKDQVHAFYDVVLQLGGNDEGAPGPRDYSEGYYGAYCRDLDGNKLHVFCIANGLLRSHAAGILGAP
ncbi:MAG: catechol 2,3-dioxygenase-like lactoylglutathione lyase family enzyme [Arenicella sp.]